MKRTIIIALSVVCMACSKTTAPASAPSSPVASATIAVPVTISPTASATSLALLDPVLPADAETYLVPLPAWTEADLKSHPWWTSTGISDNGIRAFVSELEPAEVESKLISFLESDARQPLPETGGFFDQADSRLALYAKQDDTHGVATLVSPLGQPPKAWESLGLPSQDWVANSALLEGKKSVVVIFSGHGTSEYLKNQSHNQSSGTGTATPESTATVDFTATASPGP